MTAATDRYTSNNHSHVASESKTILVRLNSGHFSWWGTIQFAVAKYSCKFLAASQLAVKLTQYLLFSDNR